MTRKNILTRAKKKQAFALIQANRLDEALKLYAKICEIDKGDADAWFMLGAIQGRLGKPAEVLAACRQAIAADPDHVQAYYNLATALKDLNRLEEAAIAYGEALRRKPDYVEAREGLAFVRMSQGRMEEAVADYREALRHRPGDARVGANLGSCLQALGRLEEAAVAYRRALAHDVTNSSIRDNLGSVLCDQGRIDEAVSAYRDALRFHPADYHAHSNLLLTLHYLPDADPAYVFDEHKRWARSHGGWGQALRSHANPREPDRKLRIGYVSPDFRTHSVSYFFESLISNHDNASFETFCYSDVNHPDDTTARLKKYCTHWRDCHGISDAHVMNLIRSDKIDILVDLAGHTAGNRLRVFALKPAPVQVTYLGYPGTTGLPAMDYRLTDTWADPPGMTEPLHTEKLYRLPRTFLCYRPPPQAPAVSPAPCENSDYVTFGSFNNLSKINARVVECWASILQEMPAARLLLKNKSLADAATRERCAGMFATRGIDPQRIEMVSVTESTSEHLAMYGRMDIALDTFPYNGTTTSCEALWMGVPVVSLVGQTHAGRVGVSLLSDLGLENLIAGALDDYVSRAVSLAGDRPELTRLRRTLRERMATSLLCDGKNFARCVELAYRDMWRAWCASAAGQVPGDPMAVRNS